MGDQRRGGEVQPEGDIRAAGAVELAWAFTSLAIGSALLTLSAFWHPMRRIVVSTLGDLGNRLPPVGTLVPA